MRTAQRKPATGLIRSLLEQPYRFEFAQAMRILHAWLAQIGPASATRRGPLLWIRNRTSLAFPASQIDALTLDIAATTEEAVPGTDITGQLERISITPSFGGMLGVSGYLPYHYTEHLLEALSRSGMTGQSEFFDLLSQRTRTLNYEAGNKNRLYDNVDAQGEDTLRHMLHALAGITHLADRRNFDNRRDTPDNDFPAYYAGVLRHHATSAQTLENVLAEYFSVPFHVEQFVGAWRVLEPCERARVGDGCVLETGLVLGPRVYCKTERVRLRIGPLSLDQYEQFLPHSKGARALARIVGMFRVSALCFEVQVVLRAQDVAPATLERTTPRAYGLGRAALLQTRAPVLRDHTGLRYELGTVFQEKCDDNPRYRMAAGQPDQRCTVHRQPAATTGA